MYSAGKGAAGHSAGFVLAGGGSKRMGQDKALLPLRGNVLVSHVALNVLAAAGSVSLVGSPGAYSHLHYPVVPDLFPGFGPLGGIVTSLSASASEWNLIVACDMPGVSVQFLTALLAEAAGSAADCAIPRTPDGRLHAVCAVYRQSARLPLLRAVDAGIHKLHDAIKDLNVHFCAVSAAELLANVNTPAEWSAFQNAAH